MTPTSDVEFTFVQAGIRIVFERGDNNKVNQFTLFQGGQEMVCKRLGTFDEGTVDLSIYEGNYYSEELMTTYMIRLEENKLVAKHQRHDDVGLDPIQGDQFTANVWFMGLVEFVREGEAISGMKVTNGRVRNLWFEKK